MICAGLMFHHPHSGWPRSRPATTRYAITTCAGPSMQRRVCSSQAFQKLSLILWFVIRCTDLTCACGKSCWKRCHSDQLVLLVRYHYDFQLHASLELNRFLLDICCRMCGHCCVRCHVCKRNPWSDARTDCSFVQVRFCMRIL